MSKESLTNEYIAVMRGLFLQYRRSTFASRDYYFEDRPPGGPVVFRREYRDYNIGIPKGVSEANRQRIINLVPNAKRHTHFGSLQSSQALVQSVFGTLLVLNEMDWLSNVVAEDGTPAFLQYASDANCALEKDITTLGEQKGHCTQVDVCIETRNYRVAVECKLTELDFGTCSRPKLKPKDARYERQFCDGAYTIQRGRSAMCSLTELGIRYWSYTDQLFSWSPVTEHRPCPLHQTYQLVRNVLAACVQGDGTLDVQRGHALILYDERNPTMRDGGIGDGQWCASKGALNNSGVLRRLSWQGLLAQSPNRPAINALRNELNAKYGFASSGQS